MYLYAPIENTLTAGAARPHSVGQKSEILHTNLASAQLECLNIYPNHFQDKILKKLVVAAERILKF